MSFLQLIIHVKSDSPTPSNLTVTYKSPSTVLLEWMFSDPVVGDTMYTVYYQFGGVSYNTSFTLTEDQRSYLMMDLPLEVITNVFIVAVTRMENHLPSPVVGMFYIAIIRASVDALCRDGTSEISRDPRTKRLQTRRESLARPSKHTNNNF